MVCGAAQGLDPPTMGVADGLTGTWREEPAVALAACKAESPAAEGEASWTCSMKLVCYAFLRLFFSVAPMPPTANASSAQEAGSGTVGPLEMRTLSIRWCVSAQAAAPVKPK